MPSVQITVLGTEQLVRNVRSKSDRAGDFSPILRVLARDFKSIMRKQFDSEGAYLGTAWAPLAESTIKSKASVGADSRILHRTRVMRKSFTMGSGGVRFLSSHELVIDTSVRYAGFHQYGTRFMPKREIFVFNEETQKRWLAGISAYLYRGRIGVKR